MDSKDKLIKSVILKLSNTLSTQQLFELENVLTTELQDYNIEQQCSEISIDCDDNIRLLREFIATKNIEGLSENSLKRYWYVINKFLSFINKPIDKICENDIKFYFGYCKSNGNSDVTVLGISRCISSFWSFLTIEGYITYNPCLRLHKIKTMKKIKKPLSNDELAALRRSCNNDRDKALIEFLYSTGMRVSEVVQCNIDDIDFTSNQCIVKHAKGGKQRYVYLTDQCIGILQKYLNNRHSYSTALFTGRSSNRLSKNSIENIIRNIGKHNGVHVYPHKFRRTCACDLLKNDMNIYSVSKILGHSNLNTTERYLNLNNSYIKDEYMKCMNDSKNIIKNI